MKELVADGVRYAGSVVTHMLIDNENRVIIFDNL